MVHILWLIPDYCFLFHLPTHSLLPVEKSTKRKETENNGMGIIPGTKNGRWKRGRSWCRKLAATEFCLGYIFLLPAGGMKLGHSQRCKPLDMSWRANLHLLALRPWFVAIVLGWTLYWSTSGVPQETLMLGWFGLLYVFVVDVSQLYFVDFFPLPGKTPQDINT